MNTKQKSTPSKHAVILAGGLGSRLGVHTKKLPKALLPRDGKPMLEIILLQLKKQGFGHFTLALNHYSDMIINYFGDGSEWGVQIKYSIEKHKLGTIGPLSIIEDLPENFLVINCDVITDLDMNAFYEFHLQQETVLTIASHPYIYESSFGILTVEGVEVLDFKEKPKHIYHQCMGVYWMNAQVLSYIPYNQSFGIDDLIFRLIQTNQKISTFFHTGQWLDIGTKENYFHWAKEVV